MTILKNSPNERQRMKGYLATILDELGDLDVEDAREFIKWTCKKASLYKKAILHTPYVNLPINMQRGDIVLCDLGVNIPPEFSDQGTGKHFVMFWAQQGHNAIVIPITQEQPPQENIFTIPVGRILGLPSENNYVKLDAIRSVSLRRILRVVGHADGKLYSESASITVKKYFEKLFISS